jgi:hypothetical protein
MSAEPLTVEQIESLKGKAPEGVEAGHWETFTNRAVEVWGKLSSVDRYVLRLILADAKAREAAERGELPGPPGRDKRHWGTIIQLFQHIAAQDKPTGNGFIGFHPEDARHILAALASAKPPAPEPSSRVAEWREVVDGIARAAGFPAGAARRLWLEAPEARRLMWALEEKPDPLDAYIHENTRDDCREDMRFRAVLPTGFPAWRATRDEARAAIREAIAKAEGGGS